MTIIDGYGLTLPPCGIKSFMSSLLVEIEKHNPYPVLEPFYVLFPSNSFHSALFVNFSKITSQKIIYIPITIPTILISFFKFFFPDPTNLRRFLLYLWERFIFVKAIKKYESKSQVVFHPYQSVSSYKTSLKKIAVVHDVFMWKYQERYSFIEKIIYNSFKKGLHTCHKIITISQTSKNEIVKILNIPNSLISVCFEGIDNIYTSFVPNNKTQKLIISQYQIPRQYVFTISSDKSYKNIKNMLHAYAQSIYASKIPLVFLGPETEVIKKYKNLLSLIVIPKVNSLQEVAYLYHLARLVLFISREEGFGLPPLEALACNTLTITSNTSSLYEIYHNKLPTVDPDNINKITELIDHFLTSSKDRQQHIIKAKSQLLPLYKWDKIIPSYMKELI